MNIRFSTKTSLLRLPGVGTLALLAASFVPATLSAVTLPLLVASQDTYIHGGNKDTSYGNSTSMELAGRGVANARKIYLGFDLSGIDTSALSFDASSSLSLTLTSSSYLIGTANGSVSINVYGITDNTALFNESTVTWTNAPKNNTSNSTEFHVTNVALLGTITIDSASVSGGTSVTLSGLGLSNYLNWAVGNSGDFYGTGKTQANAKKITLMLAVDSAYAGTSYPGFKFNSSEASVADALKPRLNLTLNPVPEPATVALVAGLVVLMAGASLRISSRKH
ncbi:DNRLRE domain-containing protein [Opitutaceae bacterium TAV4]|nr:DNRLRE domain-containing protein [Opitutaceae bacterium TAV4]RRJ99085.1 DNRLRE domain-containing protein [Opitutaceae bacterium TAV3]